MLDTIVAGLAKKAVLHVKYRIDVLIPKLSLLKLYMGKSRIAAAFQKTAVDHIEILSLIHIHEFLHYNGTFFLIHIIVPKRLYLINEILCNCLHT